MHGEAACIGVGVKGLLGSGHEGFGWRRRGGGRGLAESRVSFGLTFFTSI